MIGGNITIISVESGNIWMMSLVCPEKKRKKSKLVSLFHQHDIESLEIEKLSMKHCLFMPEAPLIVKTYDAVINVQNAQLIRIRKP